MTASFARIFSRFDTKYGRLYQKLAEACLSPDICYFCPVSLYLKKSIRRGQKFNRQIFIGSNTAGYNIGITILVVSITGGYAKTCSTCLAGTVILTFR